jgi:hypothetical protein
MRMLNIARRNGKVERDIPDCSPSRFIVLRAVSSASLAILSALRVLLKLSCLVNLICCLMASTSSSSSSSWCPEERGGPSMSRSTNDLFGARAPLKSSCRLASGFPNLSLDIGGRDEDEPGGFLLEDNKFRLTAGGRARGSSTGGISEAFLRLNMVKWRLVRGGNIVYLRVGKNLGFWSEA